MIKSFYFLLAGVLLLPFSIAIAMDYEDFGDFPDADSIKSTKGNFQRNGEVVYIEYPEGFNFGYDETAKRYGYTPTSGN